MIKKDTALQVQQRGLNAIRELTTILHEVKDQCSGAEFQGIKRGVGLSIGKIQTELLEPLYVHYPDIDDLKDK